ncbi:hypothetical protein [uncultured Enterococcus sp.]|uniref:hypothetical protein n=1 Tax=uncultured Enterococcus sp. TaxID=167972 RepID=UPI0025EB7697|nr:hypothetical protein [uncultured Enterococcus sp.]
MNRHVYCLTYNDETGVWIESLDIKEVQEKYVILNEESHVFSQNKLPLHDQYRVQQTAEGYLTWCIDRENILKMKADFLHDLAKDLTYLKRQAQALELAIAEVEQLTVTKWEVRE